MVIHTKKREECNPTKVIDMSVIRLRTATHEDFDFIFTLHTHTMKEYVEKVWGWDEAWQRTYCLQHFDPELLQIVVLDCTDIGCISVIDNDRELLLSSIEILPEYQNKGIGTFLIKEVILHAQQENKPVSLQVLKTNKRAKNLYQRLGFSDCGETETHYRMTYG